jgi:AraC-like DNA-binding protein
VASSRGLRHASRATLVGTRDKHEAEQLLEQVYLPNRVEPLEGGSIDMQLGAIKVGSTTVGRLSYGADARLTTGDATHYHVNVPVRGRAVSRMGTGQRRGAEPGQAGVFLPDRPAEITWLDGCTQLCLMIPRQPLETELEQLLGRSVTGPIGFEPVMDLSSPTAHGWRETLDMVVREFETGPGLVAHPVAGRHVERLILDGLLLGHVHDFSGDVLDAGASASSQTVRQARTLLEEQPQHYWSTPELARRVHVSVRTLQKRFADEVGVAPMAYLQRVRLSRAHDTLRQAAPGSTTVGAVALRLGFTHPGRFAAAYRRLFGEAPSTTLQRD